MAPASPTGSAKLRIFSLSIDSNKFSQNIIAVNLGDTVHINITAVDGSYDFYQPDYGLKAILVRGQTKPAEFQATAAGRFTFYCQSCGGPDKGPVGYLEVAAQ